MSNTSTIGSIALYTGVLASSLYLYQTLNLGETTKNLFSKAGSSKKEEEVAVNNQVSTWGQNGLDDTLPNKIETTYNYFYNNEAEKKLVDTRNVSYIAPNTTQVNYTNPMGLDMVTNYRDNNVTTLESTYLNPYSLNTRRPYDDIDEQTQQPLNAIKEELKLLVDRIEHEEAFPQLPTQFDSLNTDDNIPLLHSDYYTDNYINY